MSQYDLDSADGTQAISATALPLPTGASTETTLSALNTKVTTTANGVKVDGSAVTQPVSAASLPLPSGASTSALQTTGNTSLSSIDTKTPALVSGRVPVDGSGVTQPISAASLPLPTGAATSANQSTIITALNAIDAGIPTALGQTTMSASMPVVIASNQTTIPVSIASISSGVDEMATFAVVARNVQILTNKSMISILNATGSGKKIKLRELRIVNAANTALTGPIATFSLFRMTGHSVGTSLSEVSYDSTDTVSASVTSRTGATITGEEANPLRHWEWSSDDWSGGAQDVESNDHTIQVFGNLLKQEKGCKPVTLNAGEGATLKQETVSLVGTGTFDIHMVFTQE